MEENVRSRARLEEAYGSNALYKLIAQMNGKWNSASSGFRAAPIDIFEITMRWLDAISREPDDEEVGWLLNEVWDRTRTFFLGKANERGGNATEEDVKNITCRSLVLLYFCISLLSPEGVPSSLSYYSLAKKLGKVLEDSMPSYFSHYVEIVASPYFRKYEGEIRAWIIDYMCNKSTTFTDKNGNLKPNVSSLGNVKEKSKAVLFAVSGDGNTKNRVTTEYWAKVFLAFLEEKKAIGEKLNTKKDNKVVKYLLAFRWYWTDSKDGLGLNLPQHPAPYVRFLMEDCKIESGLKKQTPLEGSLSRRFGEEIAIGDQASVRSFMRKYMEQNPMPK